MPVETQVSSAVVFVASGCSAYLTSRLVARRQGSAVRMLMGLVLWQVLQIFAAQLLAALQMAQLLPRVTLAGLAMLQITILAGTSIWYLRRKAPLSDQQAMSACAARLPTYILVCAIALASSYCLFAVNLFSSFPLGSDAMIYHLPLALRWLQDGSLSLPASGVWQFSLPGNAELMMMPLLGSGHQSAVVLTNWISSAMLALSTYLLGMWMSKGDRATSLTICLIVFSIPMVEFLTFSAYVDLVGTADICAAFGLILAASNSEPEKTSVVISMPVLFISAIACGMSLGTKPVFYLYGLVWVAFILAVLWQRRSTGGKALFKGMLIAGAGLLLLSGFWFARAALQEGNPLYPMQVKLGSRAVLHGVTQIEWQDLETRFVGSPLGWLGYPWTEWKRDPGYLEIPYGEGEGLGAVYATFVPLGIVFLFWRGLKLRSAGSAELGLLLLLAGLAFIWWIAMERVVRYGLPIVVFSCILCAPLLARLQANRKRAFRLLLAGSLFATSTVSGFVPFHMLAGRIRTHGWSRAQVYNYPKLLDGLPPGSVVLNATTLTEKNFALAGKALTNRVVNSFEVPEELTSGSLKATGADIAVEILPGGKYQTTSFVNAGGRVISDETIGADHVHWRVWRIEKSDGDAGIVH